MRAVAIILALLCAAPSAFAQATPEDAEPPVWRRLERFSSEAELQTYRGRASRYQRGLLLRERAEQGRGDQIVVTATRAEPNVESAITNVQTHGVDEGGIVKLIGRYLLVLQNGRVYVVDTQADGGPTLALASRTNVYRSPNEDTWYDEMLVSGNRVLVTGYSYEQKASEITVLVLDEAGKLSREATFYITSDDYYDTDNYATRLVNGNLVIYTPIFLDLLDDEELEWPIIRRWLRDGEEEIVTTAGRPLLSATDIYKPVLPTRWPMIHSLSVCPLDGDLSGDELECRTSAIIGPGASEFFVSTEAIFLWLSPSWGDGECSDAARSAVFRIPLRGVVQAIRASGSPADHFALDASPTEFRALVGGSAWCDEDTPLRYLRVPLSAFSATPRAVSRANYTTVPHVDPYGYQVRFTDTHLVYGAASDDGPYPPDPGQELNGRVIAMPLDRPAHATTINAPHGIIRIERAGDDVILTGYRTDAGLSVSLLDLSPRYPRIAQTILLPNRYESEGRSHAFNALVREEGDGIMGLPTITIPEGADRWYSRSESSDVSFLTLSAQQNLADAGTFVANPEATPDEEDCEVSCVDWYGNTRALFIGDRVFGLSGAELIEGELRNSRIVERQRLNLARPANE
jgi:hypothetical protein